MSALRDHDNRAGSRASSILRAFDPFQALRAIRESATLRSTLRLVAFTLVSHAGTSGESWPSYATLGRETGLDRRTAISAVAALESAGILEKIARRTEHGDRASNLYRLRIGLPERPREVDAAVVPRELDADEHVDAAVVPREVDAQLDGGGDREVPTVVIAQTQGGDRTSPKHHSELSIQGERVHAPVECVRSEGDSWTLFLAEYSRQRVARYGVKGLIERVSAEQRAAVNACLDEARSAGVALEPLVRSWFDQPGRDGYLREKRHPFRALLADLDGLIAAAVSRSRERARARARAEVPIEPREARSERPASSGLAGAAGVLQALRSGTG